MNDTTRTPSVPVKGMTHDNVAEPTVRKPSVPVMRVDDEGRACWLEFGKDTYRWEPELERIWKARTMQPYYEDELITIYNSDCRAVSLLERPALVLTDPPYGMNYKHGKGATKNGKHPKRGHLPPVEGDKEAFDPSHLLNLAPLLILWGANHFADKLPTSPAWYIWDKRDGISSNDNSDCEVAWANFGGSIRIFRHTWNGVIRASENGEKHLHSTQKPVALMAWCLAKAGLQPGALVYDPYMGSGPVALACKALGLRYIGVEIVQSYCDVTISRLNTEFLPALVDMGASFADLPLFSPTAPHEAGG